MTMVVGSYRRGGVVLEDKSGEEYLKRHMGRRMGEGIFLNTVEALYAMEMGWLEGVYRNGVLLGFPEYLRSISERGQREVNIFIVYRDLRRRGHVARWSGGKIIEVLKGKSSNVVKWVIYPLSYKERVPLRRVFRELKRCVRLKRTLILAFYDTEGDVTYYRASPFNWIPLSGGRIGGEGEVIHFKDLAVVVGRDEGGARGRWRVSFMDRCEDLLVGGRVGEWDELTHLYKYISELGYTVKSGLKYGSHFRIYKGDSSGVHSQYLLRYEGGARPSVRVLDLLAAARIAHGVRKELVLGIRNYEKNDKGEGPYLFLSLKWARI